MRARKAWRWGRSPGSLRPADITMPVCDRRLIRRARSTTADDYALRCVCIPSSKEIMNDTNHAATWGILLAIIDVGFLTLLGVILIVILSWSERSADQRDKDGAVGREFPSAMTLLRRALMRRCPVCGRGRMFKSYFAMNERCAS